MGKVIFLLISVQLAWTLNPNNLRTKDPVVLKGSDIPELVNEGVTDLESVVGFAYDAASNPKYTQVPIQIDEMHLKLWSDINPFNCGYVVVL